MKGLIFSGSHSRHLYVHRNILDLFDDLLIFVIKREDIIPKPPLNINKLDESNFKLHFEKRKIAETNAYGNLKIKEIFKDIRYKEISKEELNGENICNLVKDFKADISFIFGSKLIKSPLIDLLPENKINLHCGLSPRYRGSATFFWPFYFLEPQFTGVTFHQIVKQPDAGEIIHQSVPELSIKDGIHDVAAKAVLKASDEARVIINKFKKDGYFKGQLQKNSGKLWLDKDFKPHHLRLIYNTFNDDIVKQYLTGNLSNNNKPDLFSCL